MSRIDHLANGLTVISRAMPGIETASVGLFAAVGSRHEEARLNGLAHLFEHMVFKGAGGRSARALSEAITAGDLEQAKAHYQPARVAYGRLEPVAARFSDLAAAIDAGPDYFERREQDAAFKGFHRLEYGLFAQNSTDGLAPLASALMADVLALQSRISSQSWCNSQCFQRRVLVYYSRDVSLISFGKRKLLTGVSCIPVETQSTIKS